MQEKISLEKRLENLNKMVADLENLDMPMEDAMQLYADGIALCEQIKEELGKYKTQIEYLTKDE